MSFLDNLWTIKIIGMLATPFKETAAFKFGIIDENGKYLKKSSELKTQEEKSAFDLLDRFVFSLKKLINKTPGGESRLKSLTAAYFLIKENMGNLSEEVEFLNLDSVTAAQMLFVQSILEDIGGAPVNSTGPAVSTDEPKIDPKKKKYAFVKRGSQIQPAKNIL